MSGLAGKPQKMAFFDENEVLVKKRQGRLSANRLLSRPDQRLAKRR